MAVHGTGGNGFQRALQAEQQRRDYLPDGAGVDRIVSMPTYGAIHRAVVHAGAATYTAQCIAKFTVGYLTAMIIQQYHVKFVRT